MSDDRMKRILSAFIDRIEQNHINLYGIIVYQDGSITAEHYFAPDEPRSIYSVSKSFMVTAVGQLLEAGLLRLSDRPADFFPEHLPHDLDPRYRDLTLEHLLTMSSGHRRGLLMGEERKTIRETDWIRFVFSQPLVSGPGEKFMYSNGSSYLAGCMAEKAAGVKLADYLYESVFKTLDIPRPEWDECPMGHTFAASTLKLRLSDMQKLGILYLNEGEYGGRRIVSKDWVKQAASHKIDSRKVSIKGTGADEVFGYGYQFWLCRYPGVYRAAGSYGQFVIVLPEKHAVIATSACEKDHQRILDVIWESLLPEL